MSLFYPTEYDIAKLREYHVIYQEAVAAREIDSAFDIDIFVKLSFIARFNATQYQMKYSAIFETHARINHSCSPNAIFYAGAVKAISNIEVNDAICISYLSNDLLISSTRVRCRQLQYTYLFTCNCNRCTQSIDLTRIILCKQCNKNSVVMELQSNNHYHSSSIKIAHCLHCQQKYTVDQLPFDIECSLEDRVILLQKEANIYIEEPHIVTAIQSLHTEILLNLGGVHWTAAAMVL